MGVLQEISLLHGSTSDHVYTYANHCYSLDVR